MCCAIRIQKAAGGIEHLVLRIGIHQGDVVQTETDVLGSGVHIASRGETVAPPGGVTVSDKVQCDIAHHADLSTQSIGFPKLKGIDIGFEVFCITNEGLPIGISHGKVEASGRLAKSKSPLLLAAAATVVLAVVAAFFLKPVSSVDLGAIPSKSIAVLPFDNFAKGEADENFADGLTGLITATLSKIGELKVISRTSVMAFKGGNRPTSPEIAAKLNVAHVLEGSVQRAGEQVRIIVQLIDAREDRHLWSETFDGNFSELFDVQTRVATNIASYLEANLTQQEQVRIARRPTENMKAYEHYMVLLQRGIVHIDKRELDVNLALADNVVLLDEKFAEAHAIIALCHLGYYWSGYDHTDARRALAKASVDRGNYAASLKAIESITADPFLSQSRVIPKSLARMFVYAKSGESDKVKAELESSLETLKRMANKNPIDPRVQMNMGLVYSMQGDEEQAVMRGQQAMALYPLSKNAINAQRIHIQMGSIYLQLSQADKCIELLDSLKDKPLGMEIGELKTNATWDPVRDHEVFKAIIQ